MKTAEQAEKLNDMPTEIDDYIHERYCYHESEGLRDSELVSAELILFYDKIKNVTEEQQKEIDGLKQTLSKLSKHEQD